MNSNFNEDWGVSLLESGREIGALEEVTLSTGKTSSFQEFQDIYNEITGKKERISKAFKNDHITTLGDVDQLNYRITQTL